MWTIIILVSTALVMAIVGVRISEGKYADFEDYFIASFFSVIISGGISTGIAFALPISTTEVVDEFEIVSLQDNSSADGDFVLGCGSISGSMKYVFYYKDGESYRMFMVDYYRAEIVLSDVKSYNKQIRTIKDESIINKFAFGALPQNRYIFYIPKGSIKQNYKLDAK